MPYDYRLRESETAADGSITQEAAVLQSESYYNAHGSSQDWPDSDDAFAQMTGPLDEDGSPMPGYTPQLLGAVWVIGGPWWILIVKWILINP